MPAWIEQISANKAFIYGTLLVVVLTAILLIIRMSFGRKLNMPGTRSRLPRLGIVDAFALDQRRQLVIVRRDNVEHLVLIGGPNDLLIESEIIRVEARDGREARAREKESREREVREPGLGVAQNGGERVAPSIPRPVPVADAGPQLQTPPATSFQAPNFQAPPFQALSLPERSQALPGVQNHVTPAPDTEAPRTGGGFVPPPRPNPFPVPPRRAPVTTPLPKTLSLREPSLLGRGEPSQPRGEASAKVEPVLGSPPLVSRPPLPAPVARPLQRSLATPQIVPPSPERTEKSESPERTEKSSRPESGLPLAAFQQPAPASVTAATELAAPPVAKSETLAEPEKPADPEMLAESVVSTESKDTVAAAKAIEPPPGSFETDMLQALEEEMAKLLGRE